MSCTGSPTSSAAKSCPARLSARAEPYQVAANSGPGKNPSVSPPKSLKMLAIPVEPSVALVAVHVFPTQTDIGGLAFSLSGNRNVLRPVHRAKHRCEHQRKLPRSQF